MNTFKTVRPRKSLGQNFLTDENIARKIVNTIDIKRGDLVVEIGCGTGALTKILLENKIILIGVELDSRAIVVLEDKFPKNKYPDFELFKSDFRDFIFHFSNEKKVKVIGNIPYYMSGDTIFKLIENAEHIEKAVLTVQKEFADRLVAKPRTKDYGALTVILKSAAETRKLFDIPPSCFYPIPKVTSTVIEIVFNNKIEVTERKKLTVFIKAAFGQRRKTLKNSLKNFIVSKITPDYNDFILKAESLSLNYFTKRAEELELTDFINLHNYILNGCQN